jgi:hypothetical protein
MYRRRFDRFGPFGLPHRRFGVFFGSPRDRFFFGFPHRRFSFFFGFPPDPFFFGFPRDPFFFDPFFFGFRHHRFFFLNNPFFFGFRDRRFFFPNDPFFFGFPGDPFFFGFPGHRFEFFGFPHRRFGFFGPGWFPGGVAGGGPLGFDQVGGDTLRSFGGPYLDSQVTGRAADTLPAAEVRPLVDPRVAVAGAGGGGDSLVVDRVSVVDEATRSGLRLTWKDAGQPAEEVALFLADATRSVLAAQSIRTPPYSALFEPTPGTAFVGMTVVWPDGSTSTRLVAYRAFGR